jgi:hypothetical protein
VDPEHIRYVILSELATASDKAPRDAPGLSVCEIWTRVSDGRACGTPAAPAAAVKRRPEAVAVPHRAGAP